MKIANSGLKVEFSYVKKNNTPGAVDRTHKKNKEFDSEEAKQNKYLRTIFGDEIAFDSQYKQLKGRIDSILKTNQ